MLFLDGECLDCGHLKGDHEFDPVTKTWACDDDCANDVCGAPDRAVSEAEECDPTDDVQDHHDWDYETHGGSLGICRRCGTQSQGWEE